MGSGSCYQRSWTLFANTKLCNFLSWIVHLDSPFVFIFWEREVIARISSGLFVHLARSLSQNPLQNIPQFSDASLPLHQDLLSRNPLCDVIRRFLVAFLAVFVRLYDCYGDFSDASIQSIPDVVILSCPRNPICNKHTGEKDLTFPTNRTAVEHLSSVEFRITAVHYFELCDDSCISRRCSARNPIFEQQIVLSAWNDLPLQCLQTIVEISQTLHEIVLGEFSFGVHFKSFHLE